MLSKSLLASFLGPLLAAAQLNELAQKAGKLYFGTATDNGELSNTTYLSILSNTSQFGQLTPGNGMKVLPPPFPFSQSHSTLFGQGEKRGCRKDKRQEEADEGKQWEYVEPELGVFNYSDGTVVADLAKKNGQILRCHNLVWHSQLAPWGIFSLPKSRTYHFHPVPHSRLIYRLYGANEERSDGRYLEQRESH